MHSQLFQGISLTLLSSLGGMVHLNNFQPVSFQKNARHHVMSVLIGFRNRLKKTWLSNCSSMALARLLEDKLCCSIVSLFCSIVNLDMTYSIDIHTSPNFSQHPRKILHCPACNVNTVYQRF